MQTRQLIADWLIQAGLGSQSSDYLAAGIMLLGILLLGWLADRVARRMMLAALRAAVEKSRTRWDDILLEHKVFHRLAHVAPAVVVYVLGPYVFPGLPSVGAFLQSAAFIYMALVVIGVLLSFLDGAREILDTTETGKALPLTGLSQALKLVLIFVGFLIILSSMTDKTPLYFLSGLGAFAAVLMLVFKDPILGFVAGIQLSSNRMVTRGDWISMPQYGADGDVLDVTLTTVKVQNWDKTISTIPTYALISSSFKNWRGMQASGGRRIKRALHLDMNSVRFLNEEELGRLSKVSCLSGYIERKREEIEHWNREHNVEGTDPVNARRMTNLGTFRAYVESYLRNSPRINQDMTLLVRHLEPGANGIPLEIYTFSASTVWAEYEALQADIFDHLLAVLPEFGLRVYQAPSGADFSSIARETGG